MRQISTIAVTVLLLSTAPVAGQMMGDWDSDAGGTLSRDEWNTGFDAGTDLSGWDADGDGFIADREFGEGLFDRFDADEDGMLSTTEWGDGLGAWYGDNPVDLTLDDWDSDADGLLSRDEFADQSADMGLYEDFRNEAGFGASVDGIATDDFGDGVFNWYDADDDDQIGLAEDRW